MADPNKIIFGAEFEGEGIKGGIDELLDSLDKVREAEGLLKQSIAEVTKAMKENRKEAEALAKQKFIDPKMIDDQKKKLDELNVSYENLTEANAQLGIAYKKTSDLGKEYTKTQNEHKKASEEAGKHLGKLTNLHHLAGEATKKVTHHVKDLVFGLVTGFAGGAVSMVLPAIEEWIHELMNASHELTELEENQKKVNEVLSQAAKAVGDDVAKLEVYKMKLNDTNIPAAERIKIAKEYNKTAEETNKIDLKQIDNLQLINEKIEAQNKLIIQRAISVAALARLTESSTLLVDATLQLEEGLKRTGLTEEQVSKRRAQVASQDIATQKTTQQALDNYTKSRVESSNKIIVQLSKEEKEILRLMDTKNSAQRELEEMAALLGRLITPEGLTTPGGKGLAEIENVFAQKLAELKARLAAVMATGFQSEGLIREKFAQQLNKEFTEIAKLIREKKLTGDQGDILKALLQQINDAELSQSLEEFRKKVTEALKKVNDAIFAAQIEAAGKRVANIRDEFDRDREAIEQNYAGTVSAIQNRQRDLLKQIDDDTKKGLLSTTLANRKKFITALVFGDLLNQAEFAKLNAQADLAFKTFQRNLENAKIPFQDELLGLSEETTQAIRVETAKLFQGQITYDRYQKTLTTILKREARQRRDIAIAEAESQLVSLEAQLKSTQLTDLQRTQLENQVRALKNQIQQLKREQLTGAAKEDQDEDKARLDRLLQYVNAVQQVANSVVSFWQQMNQAEAAALDRSIALQNRRVDNARELAEKGNAEFLEMEQKRLDELERKREANARKQLAINNALAASQAIVAAISAIAQATQSGSPIAAIAAVAAVIGAIAAVYQFANSLDTQSPSFFEGTELVTGPAPAGKDKVKANLHVGERVVRASDNKNYWDSLSAIHNHLIPPHILNEFVNSYPNYTAPGVDLDRLAAATQGFVGGDSLEVLSKLDRLNGTMEQVVNGLSEIGIEFNLDEDGFEASISKASKKRMLRRRA